MFKFEDREGRGFHGGRHHGMGHHAHGRHGGHEGARCGPGGRDGEDRGRHLGRHGGRGHGEGRGFGRGRRMFGPGDLRLVLLALIEQEPRHGYDLIKAIETIFGGGYAPSPGVVYPTLSLLADEGLIEGREDDGGKRVFSITATGREWLDQNRATVDGVMQRMALAARMVSGEQTPEVVRQSMQTLKQAVIMKPGDWSDAETARVVETLMKAVRDISEG